MASYEEFEASVDQAVREQCELWGLPWDYRSVLSSEALPPEPAGRPRENEASLADRIAALSDEELESELDLARAKSTAYSGVAARMDGARHGERSIHGEVSELVDRAFRAGQMYALLNAARSSRRRGDAS